MEVRLDTGTKVDDLVDVRGPRRVAARARADAGAPTFDADLRLLRRRVLRRWAAAVAGRYAIGALAVAVPAAALAAFGAIGWAWAAAVPAALFLVALTARLSRPPSTAAVARLLDDRLGLFDVTATALELERSGEPIDEGPAAPVFAEAAALLRAGAGTWRPRSRLGARELGAAVGLVAALALIVALGTAGAGGGGAGKVTAVPGSGRARHKGHRMTNVSPPLAPPRAKRKGAKGLPNQEARSPFGLYAFGYEGRRPLPKPAQGRQAGLYSRGSPSSRRGPETLSPGAPGERNEAREKAEAEAAHAREKSTPGGGREGGTDNAPDTLKSLTGGQAPPSGSVSPLPNANAVGNPARQRASAGAPGGPAGSGRRAAAGAAGRQGGGSPAGGGTAGGQRAALARGEAGREGGRTGNGALGIKAGFAAGRGRKSATAQGPRNAEGGGGPGRAAGVGGPAFEEAQAGALGYVPPDAGVAAALDPGLFARYLSALARIEGRRW